MTKKALLLAYIFFFFMYFIGFGLIGDLNGGLAYDWKRLVQPLRLSMYLYTILTVVLAHFVVFRKYYYARPRWKLWLALVTLLVFFILFRFLVEETIYPAILGFGNYNPVTTFRYYVIDNIYFGSVIIFMGFVLFMFDEMFRNQQQQAALLRQNREAELNFLQAQMNPHFLFNSLNNIYSLAYEQHPKTAEAVLKLSDMMRYVTYEREHKVLLEKELEYVRSLIDIQQLRHERKLQVKFMTSSETLTCEIMPLLLVPLVENALKYGDLFDAAFPLLVSTGILQHTLQVTVVNKISPQQTNPGGGVGLKNLQRRLELSYRPGEYFFRTEKKDNIFSAKLIIPLS